MYTCLKSGFMIKKKNDFGGIYDGQMKYGIGSHKLPFFSLFLYYYFNAYTRVKAMAHVLPNNASKIYIQK